MEKLRLDNKSPIVYNCGEFIALVLPFDLFKGPQGKLAGLFLGMDGYRALNDGQAAKCEVKKEPKGLQAGNGAGL